MTEVDVLEEGLVRLQALQAAVGELQDRHECAESALEELVGRPGRKTQDRGGQNRGQKRPQHHQAADHEQHHGRDADDELDALFHSELE